MGFAELEEVVLWGRSWDEYVRMFDLAPHDLCGRILDCAGGPASFNAEATSRGHAAVSCDPIYRFTAEDIRARIDATYETVVANASARRDAFVWRDMLSPEHMGRLRMAAMRTFLEDFPRGFGEGRYLAKELPRLNFGDDEFDLALCSHFLFTYSDKLSAGFHVAAIEEMCRVAGEARVFPLLEGYAGLSPHVALVREELRERGYRMEVRRVPYEFQRGGDQMLVARR